MEYKLLPAVKRGDTWKFPFRHRIKNSDGTYTAISLTSGTLILTIKASLDDTDASAVVQEAETSFPNGSEGTHQINIAASLTSGIAIGNYYIDIRFIDYLGDPATTPTYRLPVVNEVTKRIV